jgi:nucleolar protein 58
MAAQQPPAEDKRASMMECVAFEEAGQWEAPSLAGLAEQLFSSPAFKDMCERGLNMQLKRTKDGATAETRIAELAGLSQPCMPCYLHPA